MNPINPPPPHPAPRQGNLAWLVPAVILWGVLGWLMFVELPHAAGLFDRVESTPPEPVRWLMQARFWLVGAVALLAASVFWKAGRSSIGQICVLATPAVLILVMFIAVHHPIVNWIETLNEEESSVEAVPGPRDLIEKAVVAHGGLDALTKTFTGKYRAVMKSDSNKPAPRSKATWKELIGSTVIEETFQLPFRYRRRTIHTVGGKESTSEIAVTNGIGWVRDEKGIVHDYEGPPHSDENFWQSSLRYFPHLTDETGCDLKSTGVKMIGMKKGAGVLAVNKEVKLKVLMHFDRKTGLLLRSQHKTQFPLMVEPADIAVVYDNYQTIGGVCYPMLLSAYLDGEKIFDMEIQQLEFLAKIDDALFARP